MSVRRRKSFHLSLCIRANSMHRVIVFLVVLLVGCGKRPRSLVSQKKHEIKPLIFDVPRATRLRGTDTGTAINLHWQPIADERLHSYAIYKFSRGRFLRHKPFAIIQAPHNSFTDIKPYRHDKDPCYALRPYYIINSYVCMGALSNVLCFEKKK